MQHRLLGQPSDAVYQLLKDNTPRKLQDSQGDQLPHAIWPPYKVLIHASRFL